MSGWPQCFDDLGAGSQYGWRTFKGGRSFHYGRDQAPGTGRQHIAKAAGRVVGKSRTNTFGFYLIVQYDGSSLRHHIHQMQDRGRPNVGQRFHRGALLGYVGNPLLHLPWGERAGYLTWSGSDQSTGSHSHEEGREGVSISTAVDLRGPVAAAAWARITAAQSIPAGSSGTPLEPEDTMNMQDIYDWRRTLASGGGNVNMLEGIDRLDQRQEQINNRNEELQRNLRAQVAGIGWGTIIDTRIGGTNIFELTSRIERAVVEGNAADAARDAAMLDALKLIATGSGVGVDLDALMSSWQEASARAIEAADLASPADLQAHAAEVALSAAERAELDELRAEKRERAARLRAEADLLDPAS